MLKKLQSADGMTADADVLAAQKGVQEAAANSTMYRTAATWYGVPVKDLTDAQFDRFKRIAVAALAGAVSIATMMIAFISHAQPRNPAKHGELLRAIRAWVARRRKNVVRTVVKTVEKPVGEKIVEKRVDVPGPERIVVKHIHVPVDLTTNRVVNRDGTLGEASAPRRSGRQVMTFDINKADIVDTSHVDAALASVRLKRKTPGGAQRC